eukprot:9838776-Alexandrium_andersonii.AAC.1
MPHSRARIAATPGLDSAAHRSNAAARTHADATPERACGVPPERATMPHSRARDRSHSRVVRCSAKCHRMRAPGRYSWQQS